MKLTIHALSADADQGDSTNLARIERMLSSIELPSIRAIIKAASFGVGPVVTEPRVVDATRSGVYDPFAIAEIELHVASDVSEPGYVIEHVELTINEDEPVWIPDPPPEPDS